MCNSEEKEKELRCPVCGNGYMRVGSDGWQCSQPSCGFVLPKSVYGVEMTEQLYRQLVLSGHTSMLAMRNREGQPFRAAVVIRDGRVGIRSNVHYIEGACPLCGGRIRRTAKGYVCENRLGDHPSCGFMLPGFVCNHRITEQEAAEFLLKRRLVLDGCATNEGKVFSSVLILDKDGKPVLESRVATCPCCGGDIHIGQLAYNCSNYKDAEQPCKFRIWRNIGGHRVTIAEARQICEDGCTREALEFYREDGAVYYKRLALSPDKDRTIMI